MVECAKLVYELLDSKERRTVLFLFGAMLVGSVLEVAGIGLIPVFITVISRPDEVMSLPVAAQFVEFVGIESSSQLVIVLSAMLILFFILKNSYLILLSFARSRFVFNQRTRFVERMFDMYIHAPYTTILNSNIVKFQRNINSETYNVINGALLPLLIMAMESLVVVLVIGMLAVSEPAITVSVLFFLGGTGFIILFKIRKSLGNYGRLQQLHRAESLKHIKEGLYGIKESRVLGRTPYFLSRLVHSASEFARAAQYKQVASEAPQRILETAAILGMMLLAVAIMLQGQEVDILVSTLALFAVAAVRLIPAFNRITSAATGVRFATPSVELLYSEVKSFERLKERPSMNSSRLPFKEVLRFEDIYYRYPETKSDILKGISFAIKQGETVAFVGTSGAGKSTLVNVLLGLLAPYRGRIVVDGKSVLEDVASWRRNVGYVAQRAFILDDTVRRNVAFGIPDHEVDDAQVWSALEAAQLSEFVKAHPDGLDAALGDEGGRLSGGQRQRIAIARALYHDPDVLVLDEATAALDNETERAFVEAIEEMQGTRTIIMIAHRLSTVRHSDHLFVMEDGEIVAQGDYDSLVDSGGRFSEMVRVAS